jgi:hypothetical protein
MKSYIYKSGLIIAVLAITLSFSGCDLFDKADDVTFPAEFQIAWVADEDSEGEMVPYTQTGTILLEDNAEVKKYIDKIKEIKIERITYRVEDFVADEAVIMTDGYASFSSTSSGSTPVVAPYAATAGGVNLQTSTSETDLSIDAAGLTTIANIFKQDKKIDMTSIGVLSTTPVSFKVVSKFYVKITANALD